MTKLFILFNSNYYCLSHIKLPEEYVEKMETCRNISELYAKVYFIICAFFWYLNVQCTPVQALRLCTGRTAHRGSRGIALLFLDHDTRRGWGVSVTPRSLYTPGKTRYPLYRRLGGPQGRSGEVRKISPPTRIRSRTVQPVVSRYTDWATPQRSAGTTLYVGKWSASRFGSFTHDSSP